MPRFVEGNWLERDRPRILGTEGFFFSFLTFFPGELFEVPDVLYSSPILALLRPYTPTLEDWSPHHISFSTARLSYTIYVELELRTRGHINLSGL